MIWKKVLEKATLDINYHEQNPSLHNQMHDIIYPKYLKKEGRKSFLMNDEKITASRDLVQLSIWRDGLGILNMNT